MQICAECKETSPNTYLYCGNCGKQFREEVDSESFKECPKCGQLNKAEAEICTRCQIVFEWAAINDIAETEDVAIVQDENPVVDTDSNITSYPGVGCYKCAQAANGQCKKDNVFFCSSHGNQGFCADCINETKNRPVAIEVIRWTFNLAAILLIIGGIYLLNFSNQAGTEIGKTFESVGNLFAYDTMTYLQAKSNAIAAETIVKLGGWVAIFVLVILALIIYSFGVSFAKGSMFVTILVLLLSLFLLFTIIPLGVIGLLLLFFGRHWLEIRLKNIPYIY